jgi:hypothetical protein
MWPSPIRAIGLDRTRCTSAVSARRSAKRNIWLRGRRRPRTTSSPKPQGAGKRDVTRALSHQKTELGCIAP